MNSSKRGAVYGFKLQSLDMVSVILLDGSVVLEMNSSSFRDLSFMNSMKLCLTMFFGTSHWYDFFFQLLDTKSCDKKMTLLHFITQTVKEKFPELLNLENELRYIDKAATGNKQLIFILNGSILWEKRQFLQDTSRFP